MKPEMSRRSFLIGTGAAAGAGLGVGLWRRHRAGRRPLKTLKNDALLADPLLGRGKVVVAKGPDPADNVRRALAKSGVIAKLVSRGDTVVLKPNMAWDLPPRQGANANPATVAEVAKLCLEAVGPSGQVLVFDRTMSRDPTGPYRTSGIAAAVRKAGGTVHYVDESRFRKLPIPGGVSLAEWWFYDRIVDADKVDVLINLPAAKTHSTSGLTLGMKNVFGMVGSERGQLHQDIHRKIADLNRVVQTDLTILDATRVMFRNGPNSPRPGDVWHSAERAQRIVVSEDRVAVDAYAAAELFARRPEDVGFCVHGQEAGLGSCAYTESSA